jgi:hypothetical protein
MAGSQEHARPSGEVQGVVSFVQALAAGHPAVLSDWLATNRQDARVVTWLRDQDLAPLGFYRLSKSGLTSAVEPGWLAVLQQTYYRAVADATLHDRELGTVLRTLAAAGIVPVLFKGAALAHMVYPDSACRPMGDLDLWVAEDEMAAAQEALEQIGYVQHHKAARPVALQAQLEGEVQLVGRVPGTSLVELHWGVFAGEWLRRTARVSSAEVRPRVVSVTVLGQSVRTLAPEDALLQLAIHLAVNHQFAFPGVRGLVDIALLARTMPVNWNLVAERARAWRIATPTWLALSLAKEIVGLTEAQPILPMVAPSALRRRLLHLFVTPHSLLQQRDLRSGPLRFLLLLCMVDRPRDAFRLVWRALWPEADWLVLRYGAANPVVRRHHLFAALGGRV